MKPLPTENRSQMPEEYYEQWHKLARAERRAYTKARRLAHCAKAWSAWNRATKRLAEHESNFGN